MQKSIRIETGRRSIINNAGQSHYAGKVSLVLMLRTSRASQDGFSQSTEWAIFDVSLFACRRYPLGQPLKGLDKYEGAPVERLRGATRRAFDELVQTAIEQKVQFIVIAGDLYDGDWRDFQTGHYFNRKAAELEEAGILVYMIAGNHDAANKMTRWLRPPPNVTMLRTDKAETVYVPGLDVAIHGQGFASAAVHDDLSLTYPLADQATFNLGLLHTCASGRDGHEKYAPCSMEGLKRKGYDYWALGHIHVREMLSVEPFIAFPGNIQGRHVRESGEKGCLIVTVDDNRQANVVFHPLDVLQWERLAVDVGETRSETEFLEATEKAIEELSKKSNEKFLATRVEFFNTTQEHRNVIAKKFQLMEEIRSAATRISSAKMWVEKFFSTQHHSITRALG